MTIRLRHIGRVAAAVAVGALCVLGVVAAWQLAADDPRPLTIESATIERGVGEGREAATTPSMRQLDPYRGYGAWVDVFDFSPPYAGDAPPLSADDLDEMVAAGVRTVYLQAARVDDRSPDGLEDRWLLAEWLIGAHDRGMAVVGWYLPKWSADGADLDRLRLLDGFRALGHRFDGVAVDIEWTGDGLEPADRSSRLVSLSSAMRARTDDPLGAIVLPPVLTEVVNPDFWPEFPWSEIAPLYDVWLPMSYWSFRSEASGYSDGYTYHEESVRRLRANLDDPDALVHGIGGIGGVDGIDDPVAPEEPLAAIEEIDAFARALVDSGSVGGSVYDWNTLEPAARTQLSDLFG